MTYKAALLGNALREDGIQQHVRDAIKSIRYGSVEVVIHDGKVVQIERREKQRFDVPLK